MDRLPAYIVQASPLARMFLQQWQAQLEADPSKIFEKVDFEITVPRAFGALTFKHGKPVATNKVMPVYPGRNANGNKHDNNHAIDDLPRLINWLTGGPDGTDSAETDMYGITQLDIDMDVSGALSDIALFADEDADSKKKAAKSYEEIQKELIKKAKVGLEHAREIADSRVKRQLKKTHANLLKQYDTLKQEGKGIYAPSTIEAVGAFILSQEVDKAGEARKKMFDQFSQRLQETFITG